MSTREQLDALIEAYASAVRGRDPKAVAMLFAESFDHVVHGAGDSTDTPWSTKHESSREGIERIYAAFFAQAGEIMVEYIHRIIDVEGRAAAMVVRVRGQDADMENALHIFWNERGEIVRFHNWYGSAKPRAGD